MKQDQEMSNIRKKQEASEKFAKVIDDFVNHDSVMDDINSSNVTADNISVMEHKENSDLSLIKSEYTQDSNKSEKSNSRNKLDDSKPLDSENKKNKRKVNVFEYNNLANNNKKVRMQNQNKPLQRTDIINLESSLDFDKGTTAKSKRQEKNPVMLSQRLVNFK